MDVINQDPGVVAIVRLKHTAAPDALYETLISAGVRSVEITLPAPDSLETIGRWRTHGDAFVGAGTVRSAKDVVHASEAGAQFVVTPNTSATLLAEARSRNLPALSGALSPSEIDSAIRWGATWVKIFPVDAVGGIAYLKAISAPLHDAAFVPTGGVDANTARKYAAFGCAGVGVGSAIVDEALVRAGDWTAIGQRARSLVVAWHEGMAERA